MNYDFNMFSYEMSHPISPIQMIDMIKKVHGKTIDIRADKQTYLYIGDRHPFCIKHMLSSGVP